MSNLNYKTKKEIIIENAYRDPFLKIEDLAELADTTSKYVRTILSDANVSLMELRKEYARRIEEKKYCPSDRIILNYLSKASLFKKKNFSSSEVLYINNPLDVNNIAGQIQRNFFYQSYCLKVKKSTWGLASVFLDKRYFQEQEALSFEALLEIFNESLDGKELEISNLDIIVDLATEQISSHLGIENFSPLIRIKQNLLLKGEIVVLFLLYFDARKISFSLSHNGGITIKRRDYSI
ncbi:MAG: hypothetical protein GX336_01545 [Halanaerobiaceae bacterium]|nr:hypothetical protein [Halanaerobiaceae bacterium]